MNSLIKFSYKMTEVIFNYRGVDTIVQCNINDKMEDIINKFWIKIEKNENDNNLLYLYNANKINYELTFIQQANEDDKIRNKMNIIVQSYNDSIIKEREISKYIICPECGEYILINIENFKINLFGCKNDHKIDNILIHKFENIQKLALSKIKCNQCNENNKSNFNNEFYFCKTCNKNMCPLCKSNHDTNHIINNYDFIKNYNYYNCKKHNESFIKYCKDCNENICFLCENEHNNHDIINLSSILPYKDELLKGMEDLKIEIEKFKNKIEIIKIILNRIIAMLEEYYKINNGIINNYSINKRNYIQLVNINKIKLNNEALKKELNIAINDGNINEIFKYAIDKFYNENGEKYIGEMKNSLKNGKGVFYFNKDEANKRKIYEGDYKNDKREGNGVMYYQNGDKYEGEHKNDKIEGKGIMYYYNRDKYEGEYKNDKREGKGIMYYNNGDKYEGEYKNDKIEGKGIMYYQNGDKYEGEYKNDKIEGKGIMYYQNGDKYEGEFKNDKREGKGIMYYQNWDKYEGDYKNNKIEGKGVMYYQNGDKYEGEYKNDKREGKAIMYYNNGDKYEGNFKNDKN